MGNPRTATTKSGPASTRKTSPNDNDTEHRSTSSSSSSTSSTDSRSQRSSSDLWPEVAPEESSRRAAQRKKSLATTRDQLLYLQALFPYAPYEELMAIIEKTDGPDEAAHHAYGALNPNYTGYAYLKEQTDVLHNTKATKAQRATAFGGLKEALEERATDAFRPGMFSNLSQLQEYHETVGLFAIDTTDWDRAMLLPARELAEMAYMDLPLREEPSPATSSSSSGSDYVSGRNGGASSRSAEARHHSRFRPPALSGGNARFMDSGAAAPRLSSFDATLLSHKSQRERRGSRPRDGCRTPIAEGGDDGGVLYLQDSDPECVAPIIAWAPEAIRVGPAEARRQQVGALRVFDEATFFSDPLLGRDMTSIQLATPEQPPRQPPTPAAAAESLCELSVAAAPLASLPPLLAVSPGSSHRVLGEHHEPIDDDGGEDIAVSVNDQHSGTHSSRSSHGKDSSAKDSDAHGLDGSTAADASLLSSSRHTESSPAIVIRCDPEAGDVRASSATAAPSSSEGHSAHPDDAVRQASMRDYTVERLRSRKRRPLTSSEKVKQRMRELMPVGNIVFRDTAESPAAEGGGGGQRAAAASSQPPLSRSGRAGAGGDGDASARDSSDVYTHPSARAPAGGDAPATAAAAVGGSHPPLVGSGAPDSVSATAAAAAGAASTVTGVVAASSLRGARERVVGRIAALPPAHAGCSSLDPSAYLNEEEERWSGIVEMLKPFEDVFGAKFRCELVRCVYDDCPHIRPRLTEILRRLLSVVGKAVQGREVLEGLAEEPLDLPLFGSILLSTSPIKIEELTFREDKCALEFCEEGTRLRLQLHVKTVRLEAVQFAYIDEAAAARQNRAALQQRQKTAQPRSRAAAWTMRHQIQEKYTSGVTRGTAKVSVSGLKLKGVAYVWLMASGKAYVTFQEARVSIGSFKVATDVPKLNALFTLGSPVMRMVLERVVQDAVKGVHAL